jgi:hypothetical protein
MTEHTPHDVQAVLAHFQVPGRFIDAKPYGHGHINDTYATTFEENGTIHRYILQRVNHEIFKNTIALMENVERVTRHQREQLVAQANPDADRRALRLVYAGDGLPYCRDIHGNVWRMYIFIEKASTYEFVENPRIALEAARAFGEFQKQLVNLGGERLHETIPDFHNTPKRFEALVQAVETDRENRAKDARPEIEFALQHEAMVDRLLEQHRAGLIPERITHNDTKINNVMLDDASQEGICVIDLDTVMPGLVLYDFGDMVRTATSPSAEDEKDLSKVGMDMQLFEALVNGYLSSANDFLCDAERDCLVFSGKLITFEIGIRFLTDFLLGDVYFKVSREGHNMDRCRTQFKLVESIEDQEDDMNRVVENFDTEAKGAGR